MAVHPSQARLFFRWIWAAYLPLVLLAAVVGLRLGGLLPRPLAAGLVLILVLWAGLAIRLIVERRRRGVKVGVPRGVVVWLSVPSGLGVAGILLFWLGAERLNTDLGFGMFAAGAFLMALALLLPVFRVIDSGLRGIARLLLGRPKGRPRLAVRTGTSDRDEEETAPLPRAAGAGRR